MDFVVDNDCLTIFLSGKIDSRNVADVKKSVWGVINENGRNDLIFDADKLNYISSAGLRFLLKFRKASKKKILIENVSKDVYEVFDMTGFTKFFDVRKKLRNISIEGCAQVGMGRSSKVYRLDDDTIIKVYNERVPLYKITREIDLAKKAFLAGIPTAISYDIVRCGENYGVVFEMIANALTVGNALTADGGANFDKIMKQFVTLLKHMHQTEADEKDEFPSIKGTWLDWAEGMKKYYTADEFASLEKMINAVPDRNTFVHCDFHAGNTLYQNGEIVVIDMADFGYGHPIFDFAAGAFHVLCREEKMIQIPLNLSAENILKFWNALLKNYFQTESPKVLDELNEVFKAFAHLRNALFPMKHVQIPEEAKFNYIGQARKFFFPNIDWAIRQAERLHDMNF